MEILENEEKQENWNKKNHNVMPIKQWKDHYESVIIEIRRKFQLQLEQYERRDCLYKNYSWEIKKAVSFVKDDF